MIPAATWQSRQKISSGIKNVSNTIKAWLCIKLYVQIEYITSTCYFYGTLIKNGNKTEFPKLKFYNAYSRTIMV